jgi:hypothetical protein
MFWPFGLSHVLDTDAGHGKGKPCSYNKSTKAKICTLPPKMFALNVEQD